MTDHHHKRLTGYPHFVKPCSYERRSDPFSLVLRENCHRRKAGSYQAFPLIFNDRRCEEYVAHNSSFFFRHQRNPLWA